LRARINELPERENLKNKNIHCDQDFFKENDVSPSKSMEIGRCNKPALLKDPRST
jgi:hypothetical protein